MEERGRLKGRRRSDQYFEFLKQVPWQIYGTFTFPWKVSDHSADRTFCDFFKMFERHQRSPIGYVRANEKRLYQPSGLGKPPTGRHFHFVLASPAKLDAPAIEYRWKVMVGNGWGIDSRGELLLGGYAKVEPYRPDLAGLRYCLKGLDDPDWSEFWDWTFSDNLFLFLPDSPMNSRMRRQFRRMGKRGQQWEGDGSQPC